MKGQSDKVGINQPVDHKVCVQRKRAGRHFILDWFHLLFLSKCNTSFSGSVFTFCLKRLPSQLFPRHGNDAMQRLTGQATPDL